MAPDTSPITFTSSERIKQLNAIDKSVTQLLHSASLAISALTASSSSSFNGSSSIDHPATTLSSPPPLTSPITPTSQRATFTSSTKIYFSLLSTIDVQLRRQIYALEEAEIIPPYPPSSTQSTSQSLAQSLLPTVNPQSQSPSQSQSTDGSRGVDGKNEGRNGAGNLGSLDISWLNTRNSKVEQEMEAELWKAADELVAELEGKLAGEAEEL